MSNPSTAARPGELHLAAVVLILSAGVLAAAQVGKVPPLLPSIRNELGLSLVSAGWMTSLTTLTGALFGATFGFVADRLGATRMLLAGLALLAGAGLAGAAAAGGNSLAISRALESIGLILSLIHI